jgi:hypothetical protein
MNAIISRPEFKFGEEISSESRWREFLDEVRVCSEKIEQEVRSLRDNSELMLAIINLIPVAFFCEGSQKPLFPHESRLRESMGNIFRRLARYGWEPILPS